MTDGDDKMDDGGVFDRLYDELRSLARHYLGSRAAAPIQPTELVNEACLKLVPSRDFADFTERRILGYGARAMRQVLADHARRSASEKHGAGWARVTLRHVATDDSDRHVDLSSLDQALSLLEQKDARLAEMTELHYFAGMTGDQLAESFGISRSTVTRELSLARSMLLREIDRLRADRG